MLYEMSWSGEDVRKCAKDICAKINLYLGPNSSSDVVANRSIVKYIYHQTYERFSSSRPTFDVTFLPDYSHKAIRNWDSERINSSGKHVTYYILYCSQLKTFEYI